MENVPNILSMGKGAVAKQIIEDFSSVGYNVHTKILLASDYGVPQNRRRAFFIGFRNKVAFKFPNPLDAALKINVKSAISDLPNENVEDGSSYPFSPQSKYQILMRKNSHKIYNHQLTAHFPRTVEIISLVPDGGNYKDLPIELQGIRKVNIAWTRLNSKKPSVTIDTGHRHHFHYMYNRVPTVRESARIQSFPDTFIFKGSKTSQYKQVWVMNLTS